MLGLLQALKYIIIRKKKRENRESEEKKKKKKKKGGGVFKKKCNLPSTKTVQQEVKVLQRKLSQQSAMQFQV
jgi:hypothetical protein